jgi:hypothetical protein
LLFLKRNDLRLIGAEVRDSCGSSGTGETPQAFTPRRLTARPAESEHLEGKSTTLHYLVNSNKVWKTAKQKKKKMLLTAIITKPTGYKIFASIDHELHQ